MRRTNKNSYLILSGYNIITARDRLKEISKEINLNEKDIEDIKVKITIKIIINQ